MIEQVLDSWLEDVNEMLNDSATSSYGKASWYIDWYLKVEEQLGEFGILNEENACKRLWENARPSTFPRDYEHGSSIHVPIRAARTAILAIRNSGAEPVVGEFFPLSIVSDCRDYIQNVAIQANGCYEKGWYDACAVMVRRLIEILIIDCFDTYHLIEDIKDSEGNIPPLSKLVEKFLEEPQGCWHVERSAKPALRDMKNILDAAAHGRYRKTRQQNLDKYKESLDIALQQLVGIVERKGQAQ